MWKALGTGTRWTRHTPPRLPAVTVPRTAARSPPTGPADTAARGGAEGGAGDREEDGFWSSQQSSPVFLVEYLLFIPNQPNQSLKLTHCTNLPTLYNK